MERSHHPPSVDVTSGLILFAHGARDPRWAEPLWRLQARLAQSAPALPVEVAFLELMTPDIATAASGLVLRGARSIAIVPVFLGQGGHVRQDLAARVQSLTDAHPQIAFRTMPAVGDDEAVMEAIAAYCLRAATGVPSTAN